MKASELRIGNYVDIINRSGEIHMPLGVVKQVGPIDFFNVCLYDVGNFALQATNTRVDIRDLSPISLTEEWLLKFGFKKHKAGAGGADMWLGMNGWSLKDNDWLFRGNPKYGLKLVGYFNSNIQYVHQLQNIYFALTGEELILTA